MTTNQVLSMKAKQEEQIIQNEMIVAAAKANAEKTRLEAEGIRSMYEIPGYSEVKIAEAISQNQKIYYGDKLPSFTLPPMFPTFNQSSV